MTLAQAAAFGLILATVACFASGRFRYDLVALVSLLVGLLTGIVSPRSAFDGFKSDVVVIIACALVVSAAISRSGVIETAARPILSRLGSERLQVPVLTAATTVLSMLTKNVGALAILMPSAIQVANRTGGSPHRLLMPMAFGSLAGGLVTLVGTSTNIIISQVREKQTGHPFAMFDFAPVGLCLAGITLVYLSVAYRILGRSATPAAAPDAALGASTYSTEARVPDDWSVTDAETIGALARRADGDVTVTALIRDEQNHAKPSENMRLAPADTLILEGGQEALEALIAAAQLELVPARRSVKPADQQEEVRVVEAVIQRGSRLIGRSARRLDLHRRFGVNLLAVGREGGQICERLRALTLRAGDMLVLQAGERVLPEVLRDLGALPLAEREVRLGGMRRGLGPLAILILAMALVGFKVAPVAVGFFGAAVAMLAIGALSMRQAYASLEGNVLVLIAALVPVSEAVQRTGGDALLAQWLSHAFLGLPAVLTLALIMLIAMLSSPFLHNAPTVLILGPVAALLARRLHLNADPFLMAVATGAGCDFLTPVGHQCNTLVMGPGGYRFSDYARLGAPLSVMVIVLGAPLIAHFWPLTGH